VDASGQVFGSEDGGASWRATHGVGTQQTDVSCASGTLCATVDMGGDLAGFAPE
jgi:hypothetical protein